MVQIWQNLLRKAMAVLPMMMMMGFTLYLHTTARNGAIVL
jgi:hypothetical protein